MKIACQSCQAKYTIADEKVLGRVVKIRCKKCGATIVINGNEATDTSNAQIQPPPAAHDEPTVAGGHGYNAGTFDYAAQQQQGEEWTVNVADGDQRTLRLHEIVEQFKAGVVHDETYCWKDGMNDWLPLREIDELVAACGAGASQMAAAPSPAAPASSPAAQGGLGALFGGSAGTPFPSAAQSDANGGMYASPAAAPSAPAARRSGARAGGADLFGNVADAGGENDVMTSAPQGTPQAHESNDSKLTGQRNENSVLFSLSALTQNAPKESAPMPQGDGSGLIDIRALSATMSPNKERANHVDDIMNLGGGGAFSAALAAPVLAPPPMDMGDAGAGYGGGTQKNNTVLVIALGGGMAVLLLVVLFLLFRKPPTTADTATPTGSVAAPTGSVAAVDSTTPAVTDTAAAPPVAPVPAAPDIKQPVAAAPTRRSSGGGNSGGGATAQSDPTPKPASPLPPPSQGSSFDQMIANAAGSKPGAAPPPPPESSSAPFDRGAAAAALGGVNVQSCKRGDGPTGPGHVSVTFSPSGSVSSAVADQPPFAGTAIGGCIAAKFRAARVPAFGGGSVKVGKSFSIN